VSSAKGYIGSVTLPDAHDPALECGRLCVVIATIVINVIGFYNKRRLDLRRRDLEVVAVQ
jgi:hypothetical protein